MQRKNLCKASTGEYRTFPRGCQGRGFAGKNMNKPRSLLDAQDEIDRRRGQLIEEIEGKLQQRTALEQLFTIRWRLV
jgi:hypothetical protein